MKTCFRNQIRCRRSSELRFSLGSHHLTTYWKNKFYINIYIFKYSFAPSAFIQSKYFWLHTLPLQWFIRVCAIVVIPLTAEFFQWFISVKHFSFIFIPHRPLWAQTHYTCVCLCKGIAFSSFVVVTWPRHEALTMVNTLRQIR